VPIRCHKCGRFARAAVSATSGMLVAFCTLCGSGAAVHPAEVAPVPAAVTMVESTGTIAFVPLEPDNGEPAKLEDMAHTHQEYDPEPVGGAEIMAAGTAVSTRPIVQPMRRAVRPPVLPVRRTRAFSPPPSPPAASGESAAEDDPPAVPA
jgi:hypothetical protein